MVHDFDEQAKHDAGRDAHMRELGLEIVRISAAEVMRDADAVAQALVEMCATGPSTTQLR